MTDVDRGLLLSPYDAMAEAELSLQRVDRTLALAAAAVRTYALLVLALVISDMLS